MNREEFRLKAIIELASAWLSAEQPGGWKAMMRRAIEIADYLTEQVYGQQEPDINVD